MKLYYNYNGVTCCTPNLATTAPSGHYVAVNNGGTTYYQKLRAGTCAGVPNVNIGGTAYSFAYYPDNTDILVTPSFICKRTVSTETLCVYANGTQIMSTSGTGCNNISIPDNAVITICGPYSGCYNNWTLNDGYLALNFTEQDACFYIDATTSAAEGCGFTYHSEVDGEGCNYVCSVDGGPGNGSLETTIYALGFTTAHTYNGSVTTKANRCDNVYTTCATTFNGTLSPNNVYSVNICFPAMTGLCMYDNDCAYASYVGLELNGCCFINSTECPRMFCCAFVGNPNGTVLYPSGDFWWSGTGASIYCLMFKDYSFTRCTI